MKLHGDFLFLRNLNLLQCGDFQGVGAWDTCLSSPTLKSHVRAGHVVWPARSRGHGQVVPSS